VLKAVQGLRLKPDIMHNILQKNFSQQTKRDSKSEGEAKKYYLNATQLHCKINIPKYHPQPEESKKLILSLLMSRTFDYIYIPTILVKSQICDPSLLLYH